MVLSRALFRGAVSVLVLAFVVAGCSGGGSGGPVFPIIGDDPDGLVAVMEWGDTPALLSFPEERPTFELMGSSTPEVVRIAVESGGCPPSAQVQVTGDPDRVTIRVILGGSIQPAGVTCSEEATTHELIIRFEEPIDLTSLDLSGRYTVRPTE